MAFRSFEPERTAVYWEAEFDANGASDEEARKKIFDVLVAGMKGIKQMALQDPRRLRPRVGASSKLI